MKFSFGSLLNTRFGLIHSIPQCPDLERFGKGLRSFAACGEQGPAPAPRRITPPSIPFPTLAPTPAPAPATEAPCDLGVSDAVRLRIAHSPCYSPLTTAKTEEPAVADVVGLRNAKRRSFR